MDTQDERPASTSLWEALELTATPLAVVAIVGGGGKTSLLFALGREAAHRGVRGVLSGTTRFTVPAHMAADFPVVIDGGAVTAALESHGVVVAANGREPQQRLAPLDPTEVDALARLPGLGLIALEADGSRMRPFKAPGEHEPVVPASATHVVVVVGADAVDAPLDEEHVHRPGRVRALLERSAERCTVEVIARVLTHPEGGRKGASGRRFAVLVNKADAYPQQARALAEALVRSRAPLVVLAALRDAERPVHDVLRGSIDLPDG